MRMADLKIPTIVFDLLSVEERSVLLALKSCAPPGVATVDQLARYAQLGTTCVKECLKNMEKMAVIRKTNNGFRVAGYSRSSRWEIADYWLASYAQKNTKGINGGRDAQIKALRRERELLGLPPSRHK
jgi:hypothetical protein